MRTVVWSRAVTVGLALAGVSTLSNAQSVPGNSGQPAGGAQAGASGGNAQGRSQPPPSRSGTTATAEAFRRSGGSLYRMDYGGQQAAPGQPGGAPNATAADSSVFAVQPPEPTVIRKNDLLTVIIREESTSKADASTDLKKEADFNAALLQYFKFNLPEFTVTGQPPLTNPPRLTYDGERNFKGEGTVERSDLFAARIQATVIEVKPNGVLVIQATKQIKNDEEEIKMVLTGMVRVEDVTPDNSVLSTQLAELTLEKSTKGAARDASKRGWVPRLFDKLNPF